MNEVAKSPSLSRRLLLGGGVAAAGMAAVAAPAHAAAPNFRDVLRDLDSARRTLAYGNDGHPQHRRRALQLINEAIRETELALRRDNRWNDNNWRRRNGYDDRWGWRFGA